jgi:hypothetical protein
MEEEEEDVRLERWCGKGFVKTLAMRTKGNLWPPLHSVQGQLCLLSATEGQ